MNRNMPVSILITGFIVISLLLGGCGTSPTAKFYTLAPLALQDPEEKVDNKEKNITVAIGPVEIPEYLDRPEIVTRTDGNQLILSEFSLWGGTLKTDIHRILIENVSSFLRKREIAIINWKTVMPESYRIPVVIRTFETIPNDRVVLKAQWALLDRDGKSFLSFRETNIVKTKRGRSYDVIVTAMSEALGDLSREIAEGISSVRPTKGLPEAIHQP